MIRYYYGNLKDATITKGDASFKPQYPVTNINYLDKNLYSHIYDNDTETGDDAYFIPLIKVDFGSATTASGAILGVSLLRIQTSSTNANKTSLYLQYSDDDATYINVSNPSFYDTASTANHDITLTDVYAITFTETSHRYWRIVLVGDIGNVEDYIWDLDGKIQNLYIGDYIELPAPELVPYGFTHKTKISEAFGGSRFGVDTQGQRKTWGFKFTDLDEDDKTNWEAFDLINKAGAVPCYMESIEGSAQLIGPIFSSVYGGETLQQTAFENYEMTNNVEEEL